MDKYLTDNTLYTLKFSSIYLNNQINWLSIQINIYLDELFIYNSSKKDYNENSDVYNSFEFAINRTKERIHIANQIKNLLEEEVKRLNEIYAKFIYPQNIMTQSYLDKIKSINSLTINTLNLQSI